MFCVVSEFNLLFILLILAFEYYDGIELLHFLDGVESLSSWKVVCCIVLMCCGFPRLVCNCSALEIFWVCGFYL